MKTIPSLKHLFYGILIFACCVTCPIFAGKHKQQKTIDCGQLIQECIDTSSTSLEAWRKLKTIDPELDNPKVESLFHFACQLQDFMREHPKQEAQECIVELQT